MELDWQGNLSCKSLQGHGEMFFYGTVQCDYVSFDGSLFTVEQLVSAEVMVLGGTEVQITPDALLFASQLQISASTMRIMGNLTSPEAFIFFGLYTTICE